MRPLTHADLVDNARYELMRDAFRRQIIELKTLRRVHAGNMVTFVFENRETLRFQVQEMLRAERIERHEAIQAELDVYNALMPGGSDLSATCFIEITDAQQVETLLQRFLGLDQPGAVNLRLGATRTVPATFEPGRSEAQRISAVHYVRFPFTRADIEWWRSGTGDALLEISLRDYAHLARIQPPQRQALAADFVP